MRPFSALSMILSLLSGPGMVLDFPNMVILVICEYELVQTSNSEFLEFLGYPTTLDSKALVLP